MAAANTYLIRGVMEEAKAPGHPAEIQITQTRRMRPGTARDALLGEVEVAKDEVVRIELENGFVLWCRADDLVKEWGRKTPGRDGSQGWEIQPHPRTHGRDRASSRGWLGIGIRVLEFFGLDLTGHTATHFGGALEKKQLQGGRPGLYRCALDREFKLTGVRANTSIPVDQGPILVFIHGTASSTRGSFGKLWDEEGSAQKRALETLMERYGDRVFAWEHRSLTQSPIENALELLKKLPKEAKIHLVTHSRGGLVGELLCLGERDKDEDPLSSGLTDQLFATDRTMAPQLGLSPLNKKAAKERDSAYDDDREKLKDLLKELDKREIQVERYVRVACPARGTTLASGRLDRWLSVVSYLAGSGLVGDIAGFLLAVVKERTDPRTLPGLEAMMPGSALTRLLQHPGLLTRSDLSVIAGDVEGDSLWSQIKLLATDWFYGSDHDLVVNTGSMFGGLRRSERGARFLRDEGSEVTHFNYFGNEKSVRWLIAGLTRVEGADAGFQPLVEAKHEAPRWREAVRRSRGGETPRPLAVVIPGTMGSALEVERDKIWLNYRKLLWGGLGRIEMGADNVEATDILDDFYGPLLEYLARTHRVEIFPYDWRLSVRVAAKLLADKLESLLPELEHSRQPVHLVAHSMGGLVVRAMLADGSRGAALWRRIVQLPKSRFMMLGTPNLGSHEAVRWLTGHNPTEAKLSLLDLTRGTDDIVDLVKDFPGLLELLPFDPSLSEDFSQQSLWKRLKKEMDADWKPAKAGTLTVARKTWELLKQAGPDPEYTLYVAGCQDATVIDYRLADYDEGYLVGRKRLEFLATREGDGTVSWKSGFLPKIPVWYVEDTAHDELCKQGRAFAGYLDLLMNGTTTRLPDSPPQKARAMAAEEQVPFPLPALPPTDDIPDRNSVLNLGFGPGRPFDPSVAKRGMPVVQVKVKHGDLAYARHPVLVGHYQGDSIVSAEKALDLRLDEALSKRLRMGLYPGCGGTHALFFSDKAGSKPGGAVVVGLGQVGELTPGLLSHGVRDAMLDYALRIAQWPDEERFGKSDSPRSASLSCLMVGSGAGGIPVRDSMEAILRGAMMANSCIMEAELDDQVLIDRLEFLDLYEDTAIDAASALGKILIDGELSVDFEWRERIVETGEGGLRRLGCEEAPDWWQRLEILRTDSDQLRFIATTERARSEQTLATGQLELAETFIRQASRSPAANAHVAKTLFEMLLPNQLKEQAPQETDLVLLVDEHSARYPWELLENRWSQSGRPPAVAAGMVRQLKTSVFRSRPIYADEDTALVVGNPDLAGWELFPDLPGARQEAQKVAAMFNGEGYRTLSCIDERSDVILSGLHRDSWRILHLAGHGAHMFPIQPERWHEECQMLNDQDGMGASNLYEKMQAGKPPVKCVSGMVIGRNTLLTPGDVKQMRWVPELVFINCCHLGKTQSGSSQEYSLLAANLAVEFIRMGVRAVVAAGWAVDDAAAEAFAESFYTRLFAGETFGEAVRAAREEIWRRFPGVNTWGAYQCYGDPGYRLHNQNGARSGNDKTNYFSPAQLITELENLAARIRMRVRTDKVDEEKCAQLRGEIGRRLELVPDSQQDAWLSRADVCAALGFTWGETGDYEEAIEWLEKALHANVGDCPVRTVEQLANFQVRLAASQWQCMWERDRECVSGEESRGIVEKVMRAITELDMITSRAPTVERYSLLGSACKRLAWVESGSPRLEALINMANYYHRAYELGQERAEREKDNPDPYPFTNWATAAVLAHQIDNSQAVEWQTGLDDECRRMIQIAKDRNEKEPNFRDSVAEPDCELMMLLAESKINKEQAKERADRIVELYRDAALRGASPREYASVQEHLDFIIAVYAGADKGNVKDALTAIRTGL